MRPRGTLDRLDRLACLRAEPAVRTELSAGQHARRVVPGEDVGHQLAAATDADLVEDRLEVLLDGQRGDAQLRRDLLGGAAGQDEGGDGPLARVKS